MQSFTFILVNFILFISSTISPFWDLYALIENTHFPPLFGSFINAVNLVFCLYPSLMLLVKVHCNTGLLTCFCFVLFASGSPRYCWTTHLFERSQGVNGIWSYRSVVSHGAASVELSSPVSIKHLNTHISTANVTKYPRKHGHGHWFPGNRPWVLPWQRLWTFPETHGLSQALLPLL